MKIEIFNHGICACALPGTNSLYAKSSAEMRETMEMTGFHWKAASFMVTILEILVFGVFFSRLIKPFTGGRRGAFCTGAAYFLVMLTCYIIPLRFGSILAHSMGILTGFLVMCLLDRRNYEQKVFLAVTFFSLQWLTSAMAEILYDNLYSFAEHSGYAYLIEHLNRWFVLYVMLCLFYLTVEILLMAFSTGCILRACTCKYAIMAKKEMLMMAAPSLAGITGCQVTRFYRSFYIINTRGTVDPYYDTAAWLYCGVSVASIVAVVVFYQGMKTKQEEKLQMELLAVQVDSMMHHIGQVESLYRDIRGIRHDMTNHILTLERLYAGNERMEAEAYAADLKSALSITEGEIRSGNPVTDVILQEWKKAAEQKNIYFQCDFHFPAEAGLNAFDVSVILNNVLQNAVENTAAAAENGSEASQCTPHISVCSYRRNNAYMTEICNSFAGEIQWDIQTGLPCTSKGKKGSHGYGLANVLKIARKYCGDMDIVSEDGEFRVSVMLMLED